MPNNSAIRAIRIARGLTLKDVAERVGTTETTISRWEREPQRVTIPVLNKLAAALGCTASGLISRTAAEPQPVYLPVPGLEDGAPAAVWDANAMSAIIGSGVKNLAYTIARHDVMAPTISPGDIILVDKGHTHIDLGGIYTLRMNGQTILRRCLPRVEDPASVMISVDNALYGDPARVKISKIEILGRVVAVTKVLP